MLKKYINNNRMWKKFLKYKMNNQFTSTKELEELTKYIKIKKYKKITKEIKKNNYTFSTPRKKLINKNSSNKKRTVYSLNNDEMIILKYITFLLYKYDYLFENNLYSFRKNTGVKKAIKNIKKIKNINNMYGYKVDIKNYFNSIDTTILLENIKNEIKDKLLINIIEQIITNNQVIYNNKCITENNKGIMAGLPISTFLANYYIKEIDSYFKKQKLVYLRYSDDIIIFCNNKNDLLKYQKTLKQLLKKYKLNINNEKELFFFPQEQWEFLGFSFKNNIIDISENTKRKIKKKIKRSTKSIRRWMIKNNNNSDKAIKLVINKYNKKFFGKNNSELSWKYWFFPIINTTSSLKEIDNYFQDCLRYIATGKHNKKNYKIVPYTKLKKLGYKSLVNEYYLFINMKSDM